MARKQTLTTLEASNGKAAYRPTRQKRDEAAIRVPVEKNTPFVLGWNPNRWVVLEEGLAPSFVKFRDEGGLNGLPNNARVEAIEPTLNANQGWRFIHSNEDIGIEYIRVHTNVNGHKVWLTKWEVPLPGSDVIRTDEEALLDFVEEMVERGEIQYPSPYWAANKLESITNLRDETFRKRGNTVDVAKLNKKIEVLKELLGMTEEVVEEPKEAPKKTASRSRKTTKKEEE